MREEALDSEDAEWWWGSGYEWWYVEKTGDLAELLDSIDLEEGMLIGLLDALPRLFPPRPELVDGFRCRLVLGRRGGDGWDAEEMYVVVGRELGPVPAEVEKEA
jgi:hypothetical protein